VGTVFFDFVQDATPVGTLNPIQCWGIVPTQSFGEPLYLKILASQLQDKLHLRLFDY
jgi:hypothetical protein